MEQASFLRMDFVCAHFFSMGLRGGISWQEVEYVIPQYNHFI